MKKLTLLLGALVAQVAFSQTTIKFEKKAEKPANGLFDGASVLGEVGGKKAVFVLGKHQTTWEDTAELYVLENGVFTKTNDIFQGVNGGDARFVDIDNDGDQDIVYIGGRHGEPNKSFFKIYKNENGAFVEQSQSLPALSRASMDVGDYDNDGDMDLIVSGYTNNPNNINERKAVLYNNHNGSFTDSGVVFPFTWTDKYDGTVSNRQLALGNGNVKFKDINGDGKLDVFAVGEDESEQMLRVFIQQENGTFVNANGIDSYGYQNANVSFGDLDGDGVDDAFIVGKKTFGTSWRDRTTDPYAHIYLNKNGKFEKLEGEDDEMFRGLVNDNARNTCVVEDFNGDGKKDIAYVGTDKGQTKSYLLVYENKGNGVFEEASSIEDINWDGSLLALDIDDDGDLDLFVTSEEYGGTILENKSENLSNKEVVKVENIALYPNPVVDTFAIKGVEKVSQVNVYDMSGRLVKSFAGQAQYNIANLSKGKYVVVVKSDKGLKSFSIVKK